MPRKLTLEQINQQIAKLQAQAADIREAEKAGVVDKIKTAIEHYGITAADLGLSATRANSGGKKGRRTKLKAKVSATRVKYKDDTGNTWSGFGRRPGWFVAALSSGKTEADLRV